MTPFDPIYADAVAEHRARYAERAALDTPIEPLPDCLAWTRESMNGPLRREIVNTFGAVLNGRAVYEECPHSPRVAFFRGAYVCAECESALSKIEWEQTKDSPRCGRCGGTFDCSCST